LVLKVRICLGKPSYNQTLKESKVPQADVYPHAITSSGIECSVRAAVIAGQLIKEVIDSDGERHPPNEDDLFLIQRIKNECGE
jgi:hypothetical protein